MWKLVHVNSIQFSVLNGINSPSFNINEDLLEKLFFFEQMLIARKITTAHAITKYKIILGISNSILQTKVKLGK